MSILKAWHLRDVILMTIVAIFLGVIFWVIGPLYDVLSAALAPAGLQPLANEILLGIWVMAGPLAGYMIRIPGSATIGEFLAAVVEMFLGGQWGAATMISGIIQGFGSELGFMLTGYKHYDWYGLGMSAATTTIVTFVWSLFREGYAAYHIGFLLLMLVVRFLSIFIFGGVLTKMITDLLDRSHVLTSHQPQ